MGKCCGQGGAGANGSGSPQSQAPGGSGNRCVTGSHKEDVCHGTNERRRDLLDQLKIFLDDFDERPCQATPPQSGPDGLRPLGQYPEYMKKHCLSWMPEPRPPLITSIQAHEVRTTSDYENQRNNNTEYVSYKDGRSKPPPPTCDCAKRNGLQDQCPRPECSPPTPQCLATNPGPCCPPSLGLTGREAKDSPPQSTYQQDFKTQQPPQGGNCHSTYQQDFKTKQSPQGGNFQSTYQQDFRTQQPPQVGNFQSTYREDFKAAPQQAAGGSPGYAGPGSTIPVQGQQMICFCRVPPSTMPQGKKYLCCPLPE